MPQTTFRSKKLKLIEQRLEERKTLLKSSTFPRIFWIDNYAKVYIHNYKIKWNQVSWDLKLTTVIGVWHLTSQFLDAFWKNLSQTSPWPTQRTVIQLFDSAFFKWIAISILPFNSLSFYPELFEASQQDIQVSFKNFLPLEILNFSPSTLKGFLETNNHLWNNYSNPSIPFQILNADIAFTWKFWKWIYSSSSSLAGLEDYLLPILGW